MTSFEGIEGMNERSIVERALYDTMTPQNKEDDEPQYRLIRVSQQPSPTAISSRRLLLSMQDRTIKQ